MKPEQESNCHFKNVSLISYLYCEVKFRVLLDAEYSPLLRQPTGMNVTVFTIAVLQDKGKAACHLRSHQTKTTKLNKMSSVIGLHVPSLHVSSCLRRGFKIFLD